jgi:two-component sensor histidine kinase
MDSTAKPYPKIVTLEDFDFFTPISHRNNCDTITTYWRYVNNTEDTEDFIFTFASTYLSDVVISTASKASKKTFILGYNNRYAAQYIPDRNLLLSIKILKGDTLTYAVQTVGKSYRTYLETEELEGHIRARDNFLLGVFFGICYIFTFFLIGVFIFSKNKFFLYYLFLSEITIFIYLHLSGVGLQYIWSKQINFQQYGGYILYSLYLIAHILFVRLFFNTLLNMRKWDILLKIFIAFLGIIILSTLVAILVPSLELKFSIPIIKNLLYILFFLYGIMVCYIIYYTFKKIRRKEILWTSAGIFLHFIFWILIFSQIENNIIFRNFYSFWFRMNIFHSHLAIPHILFHITMLEYFLIVYYIAISFYRDVKRYSLAQFRLHAIENKILSAFLVGQSNEKKELSQKLHKNIIQDMNVQIDYYAHSHSSIAEKLVEIRNLIISLGEKPSYSEDYVFANTHALVSHVVNDLLEKYMTIEIVQGEHCFDFIDKKDYINLYYIITEIANNIVKHARATHVIIALIFQDGNHIIKIHDNGIGINSENLRSGLGLVNIQKRATLLEGKLSIERDKESGTTIEIAIPMSHLKSDYYE